MRRKGRKGRIERSGHVRGDGRCGVTNKMRFRSRGAALEVLNEAFRARDGRIDPTSWALRRRERRAYACIFCGGWHLTSEVSHGRANGEATP